MTLFKRIYNKTIEWSRHRHAPYYLTGASFAEASFFPVPPDVMLVTMSLAKPESAWNYATLATIGSVLGGTLGYFIGFFFLHMIMPYLVSFGYGSSFDLVQNWFDLWGFWVVFVAGFSPVPYKLFTLGAGAMHINLVSFIIASFISRGLRFFIVSATMYYGGERLEVLLHKYVDRIGWLLVASTIIAIGAWHYLV